MPNPSRKKRGRKFVGVLRNFLNIFGIEEVIYREFGADMLEATSRVPLIRAKCGQNAGAALHPSSCTEGYMELHDQLFYPGREKEFKDTFLHELGHIIDGIKRGKSDHSAKWLEVMEKLGRPKEARCHNYHFLIRKRCPTCGGRGWTPTIIENNRSHQHVEYFSRKCTECRGRGKVRPY